MIVRFGTVSPFAQLRFEAVGGVLRLAGKRVRNPASSVPVTVTFMTTALATLADGTPEPWVSVTSRLRVWPALHWPCRLPLAKRDSRMRVGASAWNAEPTSAPAAP